MNIFQKLAAVPHAFWTVLFIAAPMLFVLYFAFTDTEGNFSFSNIADLGQYTNVFILSIAFALIATAVCLIIGYPLAYFMSRQSPKAQKILMVLIMLPMWCNLLIRTYALMALLVKYHLPTECPFTTVQLYAVALSDKKRTGGTITLVVPTAWGKSVLHKVPVEDLKNWIEKGL